MGENFYIVDKTVSRAAADWYVCIYQPKLQLRWWERLLGFVVNENNVRQWRWTNPRGPAAEPEE